LYYISNISAVFAPNIVNIDETSGSLDFDLALSVCEYFRLSYAESLSILSQVKNAVSAWKKTAKQIGISRSETDLMQSAFRF
jgi:serine/threonine-protein kinase HipA